MACWWAWPPNSPLLFPYKCLMPLLVKPFSPTMEVPTRDQNKCHYIWALPLWIRIWLVDSSLLLHRQHHVANIHSSSRSMVQYQKSLPNSLLSKVPFLDVLRPHFLGRPLPIVNLVLTQNSAQPLFIALYKLTPCPSLSLEHQPPSSSPNLRTLQHH